MSFAAGSRPSLFFAFVLALGLAALSLGGCAGQECDFHSECGSQSYCSRGRCLQDCRMDFDCGAGEGCNEIGQCTPVFDGGGPARDAGRRDAGSGPRDAGIRDAGVPRDSQTARPDVGTPGEDSGTPPPPDAGSPQGTYLDRCVRDTDCASGPCVDDVGGTRMCSIGCVRHQDCASEHVCADGVCRPDDTGRVCSGAAGCALGLCAGNPATGAGECSRPCGNAGDCPAGYACSNATGQFVCVNIERTCAQCSTGQCRDPQGCSSSCRTAADCPATLGGLEYSCTSGLCAASPYVFGPDPIGAPCRTSGDLNFCRSGVCYEDRCTQACTEAGGCGPGFGCAPVVEGSELYMLCLPAGSGALGAPCTSGAQCDSALCDALGFCTRLCTRDGHCPSAMRCEPAPGTGLAFCRR